MKKLVLFLLAGMLVLSAAVSARAVYDSYQLITGDAVYAFAWHVYPLDAHNAVVTAVSYDDKPWHVTWYRDGKKFRDLTWLVEEPYLEETTVPEPVMWDGGRLTMVYSARKDTFRTVIRDGMVCPDPDNYESHIAVWTENGLEDLPDVPESWYTAVQLGRIMIYHDGDGFRIADNGEEIPLPDRFRTLPKEQVVSLKCCPYGEQSCLLGYLDYREQFRDRHFHVICADHGKERYDVTLDDEDEWNMMPDGKGGFMIRNGWPEGDYKPVKLTHYSADGTPDRKLELKGDQVVIRTGPSVTGGDGGMILYGTAVASSRRVYTAFRMELDGELKTRGLDVRNIDPDYDAYGASVYTAPDGTAYVMIQKTDNPAGRPRPVLIPFDLLEKSEDDHGLTLR